VARPRRRRSWASWDRLALRSGTTSSAAWEGGGGAEVGDVVADRGVDLVADRRDDRDDASGDGPGDGLVVERPEVLAGSATAAEDDDLDAGHALQAGEGADDAGGGVVALDLGGGEEDADRAATAGDLEDVVDGGARGRGDDADDTGPGWEGPFAFAGEQALGGEASP
jgi:hypothetical protein